MKMFRQHANHCTSGPQILDRFTECFDHLHGNTLVVNKKRSGAPVGGDDGLVGVAEGPLRCVIMSGCWLPARLTGCF